MLLDGDGTKRRLKGGHLCGPNGLRMLMRLYRKMQETKKPPHGSPPSFLDFLHRQGSKEKGS